MDRNARSTVDAVWEIISRLARWALFLLLVFFVCYVLYRIRSVVMSVFAAVLLTYVLLPGVEMLCRRRLTRLSLKTHRLIATIMVFVVFASLLAAAVSLFVEPLTSEWQDMADSFSQYQKPVTNFVQKIWRAVPVDLKQVVRKVDYAKLTSWAKDYVGSALRFATSSVRAVLEILLIPVLAFYFVYDYRSITSELYGLIPSATRREAKRAGRMVGEILQSYIFGQLILCVIAGVLTAAFLSLLGLKFVAVLALFAGITRAIPIIGPIVSGIPIVLVGALSTPGRIEVPLYLLAFVIVMHFAESKFIMPQLIGQRLRLHPAVVIIVLLIGAEFFGIVGMFLAAPVAAVIRELIRRYYVKPKDARRSSSSIAVSRM